MKKSKYNFFYQLCNGDYLAFNALKNGLAILGEEAVNKVKNHRDGSEPDIDDKILKELNKGGFLIDDHFDEYGLISVRRRMKQYDGTTLGLTVVPTLNCNLTCHYCYENPDDKVMDDRVIKQLVEFVKMNIKAGVKELQVNWYGGEPLLCMEVIEKLSHNLLALCEKEKVRYRAGIITNGTLLTSAVAKQLKKLQIHQVQITIDGDKQTHDKRRPFKNGGSSYETIMTNIKEAAGIVPMVIRINIDMTNADMALGFIEHLSKFEWFRKNLERGDIRAYYGHVKKYTTDCKCSREETLKDRDFYKKDLQLKQYIFENQTHFNHYPVNPGGCGATCIHSYVVDAEGYLYKCLNHPGNREKVVGTLFEPIQLNSLHVQYLTEGFENDEECKVCRYLPICMGGCVDVRINAKRGGGAAKNCAPWKYYLGEILKYYYLKQVEQNSRS